MGNKPSSISFRSARASGSTFQTKNTVSSDPPELDTICRYRENDIEQLLLDGGLSPAVFATLRFVDALNKRNMIKLFQYADHDANFHFSDTGTNMDLRQFWDSCIYLFNAFPDLKFSIGSYHEDTPGVVVLEDFFAEGHHTGTLEFLSHPSVPPTGKLLRDDPIRLTQFVKDKKIVKGIADTFGGLSGPPGFYVKCKEEYEKQQAKKTKKNKKSRD